MTECTLLEPEGTLVPSGSFREGMKMNRINVAIDCNHEHKASVYALVTSIKVNKNENSKYCIYLLTNNTDKCEWSNLLKLGDDNTEICIKEGGVDSIHGVDKLIYLKWNVLVMGDLSSLYNIDLEDKAVAMAENLPERAYNIPSSTDEYNMSVCLLDMKNNKSDGRFNNYNSQSIYKKLSLYYNYGYEEFIANADRISPDKSNLTDKEHDTLRKCALIIRQDESKPAERYFDCAMSEIWLKYYKMSPAGDEMIERVSYAETVGKVSVDKSKSVPVLLSADDTDIAYIVSLISSIKNNIVNDNTVRDNIASTRMLDIRIVYTQLSVSHKNMLLSLVSEGLSIVLYNIQEYFKIYIKGYAGMLAPLIFSEYDKVLWIGEKHICKGDLSKIYDNTDVDGYLIASPKHEISDDNSNLTDLQGLDTSIMLINVKEWICNQVCRSVYEILADRDYSINTALNMVCLKLSTTMDDSELWCKRAEDEEEYAKLVDSYISLMPWGDELKEEIIYYENREGDNVKEVLEKIQKLEETNARLRERNKELTAENGTLSEERERFLYEILEIRKSVTYRIGRLITFIPRKLRGKK